MLKKIMSVIWLACLAVPMLATTAETPQADLDGIKTYLLGKSTALAEGAADLAATIDGYYALVQDADFDYAALAADETASELLLAAKAQWIVISPLYEQMEGIVAGVPSLSEYDVNLDAGVSGAEDPEGGVSFDLILPDETVLERPGNLFGLLEAALWGTEADFVSGVVADLDGSGAVEFGEVLPDANFLKGAADLMAAMTADLLASAEAWEPTLGDAFAALVVMVPTMSEYFGSWKESRFVSGDDATGIHFVAISRLSDIQDILSSLQVIYDGVSPLVGGDQHEQINAGLTDLQAYIADLYTQEQDGRQFTPEEADFFGAEAQDRAMTITGQISQVAGLLGITLPD
jgi:hypothetical protein